MKQFGAVISLICILQLSVACSEDSSSKNALVGKWKLTSWSAEVPMDLNNDGLANVNLLKEITCSNKETLSFDVHGIVSSEDTFNPTVMISEVNGGGGNAYAVQVECAEGIIGFATDYAFDSTNGTVQIGENTVATLNGGELTIVYGNAIEIYNTELAEVVGTKDLTKVYTKQ
ncbi:hypothetical protein [Mangrovimonas sp. DI 80]|uniref:hypothetical protein n=1 Tax=Mangrovimonas sp. DI 80 TaxID=1779330 RepID=UPI000978862C|nr:hypothetical protein [Mangrovimonas sp. DI 80]OMP31248.1 hypothetical protein BKM32_09330 [Mangrovimonas sp. DI 80]